MRSIRALRRRNKRPIPFRKIIPNMITSGSVLCGMLSLVLTYHQHFVPAAWFIVMAVFFDFMDGKVARSLGGSTAFGVELDSLADALSFGAAPAFLVYAAYINLEIGVWGSLAAAFFALCGVLRLARFNVTHVVGPFQGIPIPAAGLALVSLVISRLPLNHWIVVAALLSLGGLMISSVPYGNLKRLKKGNVNKAKMRFLIGCFLLICVVMREQAPLLVIGIYIASGLLRFDWGDWLALDRGACIDDDEEPREENV